MKILITGHKGMLGTELMHFLSQEHEVSGIDLEEADITDRAQIMEAVAIRTPQFVIH